MTIYVLIPQMFNVLGEVHSSTINSSISHGAEEHGWINHQAYRAFARWTVDDFGLLLPSIAMDSLTYQSRA